MVISAVALLGSGATADFTALAVLRFIGGLSTAVTFVVGSALASRVHSGGRQERSAALVAVYMAGVGIGVVLSGIAVPAALSALDASGWQTGWLLMGVLALLALVPAAWSVRAVPAAPPATAGQGGSGLGRMSWSFVWYVLFGAGYVSYMTFVIALLHDQGLGTWSTAAFFIVLGAASALATLLLWGRVIGRLRGGTSLALVSAVVLLGVLPVLLGDGLAAAVVSATGPPDAAPACLGLRHRLADRRLQRGPGGRPAGLRCPVRLRRGHRKGPVAVGDPSRPVRGGRTRPARAPRPRGGGGLGGRPGRRPEVSAPAMPRRAVVPAPGSPARLVGTGPRPVRRATGPTPAGRRPRWEPGLMTVRGCAGGVGSRVLAGTSTLPGEARGAHSEGARDGTARRPPTAFGNVEPVRPE